jgi:aspartyl-tRNA(Asn)/glutamyl-tRNA(Gln) amidotransferase subunit B
VGRAIDFEIGRQAVCLESGEPVVQETRLFEAASGETRVMRSKEEAHDYRYLPEPDLGTLEVPAEWIASIRATLRETPREKRRRFLTVYALSAADADLLSSARPLAEYFEKVAATVAPRLAASWVTGEVLRWMKERKVSIEDALAFPVSPERLAGLVRLTEAGEVSTASAKEVLAAMLDSPAEAFAIVAEKGLGSIRDTGALDAAVAEVVAGNPSQVELYRAGKTQTFGWLVGQVMKKTGGRADPAAVREALTRALGA